MSVSGCKPKDEPDTTAETTTSAPETTSETQTEAKQVFSEKTNPLTGLDTMKEGEWERKPVAVMVNNVGIAQPVQAGINSADVVFETVVEGGITRLLALFKAPGEETGKIGSIRSARVVYAELAASMNALFFHCGQDNTYFPGRAAELNLQKVYVEKGNYGERIKNGKASEHTLYTSGSELKKAVENLGFATGSSAEPWLNFTATKQPSELSATDVSVKFSNASTSYFSYDENTDSYIRTSNASELENYFTGEQARFTNVFVLFTHTEEYPDKLHVKVELNGGEGYYITKGGCEKITWTKQGDFTPIEFKGENGEALAVTPGNSYICIADNSMRGSFKTE